MNKKVCSVLVFVCCFAAAGAAAGDLWIICSTGSEVFLNGESVGVAESADAGIRVSGLSPGEHTVRISENGVMSVDHRFTLGYAPTQVVVIGPGFAPEGVSPNGADGDDVEQTVGAIEITSNPKECDIRLGARKYTKKQPILMFLGLPVGEYDLRFESGDAGLLSAVVVQAGQPAQVKVDFGNNRVAVVASPGVRESAPDEKTPRTDLECVEYWVEVIRTDNPEVVKAGRDALKQQGFPDYHQKLIVIDDNPSLLAFKLRVGPITRHNMAKHVADLLKHGGFKTAWVVPAACDPSIARKVD